MSRCKACLKAAHIPPTAETKRRHVLKKQYQMTLEQYARQLKIQGGGCAICGKCAGVTDPRSGRKRNLAVDHDHITKEVRGILCHNCNTALGHFQDNADLLLRALAYLQSS